MVEAPPSVSAQVDVEKIQRVFLNLLSNAFKFVPDGGRVCCTLRAEGGYARIGVEDNGPGVPPELRRVIFERFQQGEEGATRQFGGTGLGLAIVKEFLELQGGTIRVSAAAGGGAFFEVHLPLFAPPDAKVHDAAGEAGASEESFRQAVEELRPVSKSEATATEKGRALVLVIEDNQEMNRFIVETLASHYRTASAYDGREGLAKALTLRPDLILSDVMMPEIRPARARDSSSRRLRFHSHHPAYRQSGRRAACAAPRRGGYLTKPFLTDEVVARVANLIAIKREREILREELAASRNRDVLALAEEIALRKRELEAALEGLHEKEKEVRKLNEELEQRVEERTAQLTAVNKELEAFCYSVSHDLRASLRQINAFAKILTDEYGPRLDSEGQEYLHLVYSGAQQMGQLVDDLLNLATIGRQELARQPIELREVVDTVIGSLKPEYEGRQIDWQIGPLPRVECDPGLIKQVFTNLLSNAVKYSRPRERAVIEVSQLIGGGEPAMFVRDNGVGFDMKYSSKLFGVFQRLHGASEFEGTGVGLATVQRIIQKHGGRIWAEAEPGKGAAFFFTLGGFGSRKNSITT